jgi:hypothetical protein
MAPSIFTPLFQLSIDGAIVVSLFFLLPLSMAPSPFLVFSFIVDGRHRSLGSMTPLFQLSIDGAIDILVP